MSSLVTTQITSTPEYGCITRETVVTPGRTWLAGAVVEVAFILPHLRSQTYGPSGPTSVAPLERPRPVCTLATSSHRICRRLLQTARSPKPTSPLVVSQRSSSLKHSAGQA